MKTEKGVTNFLCYISKIYVDNIITHYLTLITLFLTDIVTSRYLTLRPLLARHVVGDGDDGHHAADKLLKWVRVKNEREPAVDGREAKINFNFSQ